jgi:alpha-tubulin suppressor-like RCC1 family protein
VAVSEDGAVYSFGKGDGRLGHGEGEEEECVYLPKRNKALDGVHVTTVAAGAFHALALTNCGQVYSWGSSGHDRIVHGRGSDDGSDGDDNDEDDYGIPRLITALLDERVRGIAAGPLVSCAVTDAGALYTWGKHYFGSLGHGEERDRDWPTLVEALDGILVVGVSAHIVQTMALADDGSVYAFGRGPGLGISPGDEGDAVDDGSDTSSPPKIPNLVCMVPPQ